MSDMNRRKFLGLAGAAIAGLFAGRRVRAAEPDVRPLCDPGIPASGTATDDFGRRHYKDIDILLNGRPVVGVDPGWSCFAYNTTTGTLFGYLNTVDGRPMIGRFGGPHLMVHPLHGRVEVRWKPGRRPVLA